MKSLPTSSGFHLGILPWRGSSWNCGRKAKQSQGKGEGAKPKMLSPKIILRSIFCPKVLSFGNILGGGKLSSLEGPPSLDETLKF